MHRFVVVILLFCLAGNGTWAQATTVQPFREHSVTLQIPSADIIRQGLNEVGTRQSDHSRLKDLERWYNTNPLVEFASLIGKTITVKFIDGSYIALMNPFEKERVEDTVSLVPETCSKNSATHIAVLLNPAEHVYGNRQCVQILKTLINEGYGVTYLANGAVDVPYLRHNLTADIVYMNTHAGYFDVDGDHQADMVVIATGEPWTDETEQKYMVEYQNKLIVEGMVGDQGVIAFTPEFIDYYYKQGDFPGSLVYMATCYAAYDDSMARAFLNASASVYVGWTQNTVFWTNSRTSVHAFHLLANGKAVQQVCARIRSGGFYNWLFHSKLVYYGDGKYQIP